MWKNRILYVVAIITLFVMLIIFRDRFILNMMVALIVGAIIDYFVFRNFRDKIGFTIRVNRNNQYGDILQDGKVIPVEIKMDNITNVPVRKLFLKIAYGNVLYNEKHNCKLQFALPSYDSVIQMCELKTRHYGCIKIEITEMKVYSFLCLYKKKFTPMIRYDVLNIPTVDKNFSMSIPKENVDDENYRYSENEKGNDRSEVFDIREYHDGDNIRDIHWKLSSKREFMVLKEFSKPLENHKMIFADLSGVFDMNENNKEEVLYHFDRMLERMVNMAVRFIEEKIPFEICWIDSEGVVTYSPKEEYEIEGIIKDLLSTRSVGNISSLETFFRKSNKVKYDYVYLLTVYESDVYRELLEKITVGANTVIFGKEKDLRNNVYKEEK